MLASWLSSPALSIKPSVDISDVLVELEETSRLIPRSEAPAVIWDLLTCALPLPSALPCVTAGTAWGSPVHLGLQRAAESSHVPGSFGQWDPGSAGMR